jgi:hypothetical protein
MSGGERPAPHGRNFGALETDCVRSSRAFLIGAVMVAALIAGLCIFVASREWFSRDDFAFLAFVRKPGAFDWFDVYLPFQGRFWSFYRPLGMETYFYLGFRSFGLNAFGFFAISLAVHFASGALVFRLGRQLGFDRSVAIATALLSISLRPSMNQIFYGSIFHYVAVACFDLLAISLFLDWLERRKTWARAGSCIAVLLALLCNESAVAVPALLWLAALFREGQLRTKVVRSLRAVAPQATIVGIYLVFRFFVFETVEAPRIYSPSHFSRTPLNVLHQIRFVFGSSGALLAALALAAGVTASLRGAARACLLRSNAFCLSWLLFALAPFAPLAFAHERFSIVIEAPVSLLLGSCLNGLRCRLGTRGRLPFELAMLGLVVASVPYGSLLDRAAHPLGGPPKRFVEFVETAGLVRRPGTRVVLLCGTPGLASRAEAERFLYLNYSAGVLKALYPERKLSLRLHDLREEPGPAVLRPSAVYVKLLPDLSFERADRALLLSRPARE